MTVTQTSFLQELFLTPADTFGWGFQTKAAKEATGNMYDKVTGSVINEMKNITTETKGRDIFRLSRLQDRKANIESAIKVANLAKLLGLIPIIGRLIGVLRIVATGFTPVSRDQKIKCLALGVSEVLGYNKILAIVHLAGTVLNYVKGRPKATDTVTEKVLD